MRISDWSSDVCSSDLGVKRRFLDRMTTTDMGRLLKGAQFMTEKAGGSDVGGIELTARRDGDRWRLHGEKWFCSHADGDVALLLARPEGAPAGTRGLALFRSEEHTSELQSLMRISYAVFCLKKKKTKTTKANTING